MEGATTSIDTLGDFLAINIDISKIAPGIFPNASGISIGVNDTNYLDLNKSAHFSYPGTRNYAITNNIPLYVNGSLLVGSTPIGDEIPKIRFVGIQPENSDTRSAWIELENYGLTDINLVNFFLKWTNVDSVSIGNIVLPAGNKIRICQSNDSLECPVADVVSIKNVLPFDSVGELIVSNAGFPIDYIAWGCIGKMSDSIQMINEYLETKRFFDTKEIDYAGPVVSYAVGSFYHAVISKDNSSIVRWNLFPAKQINANASSMPSAEPLSLSDSSIVYLAPNEKMTFAWLPVDGAKSYDLIIVDAADSSLVYETITSNTSEKVLLPYGEYLWGVASSEEDDMAGWSVIGLLVPGVSTVVNVIDFLVSSHSSPEVTWVDLLLKNSEAGIPIYNLSVVPQAARKDSYMLDLKWGQYILNDTWSAKLEGYISWDSPRNLSSSIDENWSVQFSENREKKVNKEESWRCWIVVASILNHFNGGNITQDEIKFYKFGRKDPILGAFPQGSDGGGYDSDTDDVMSWALQISKSKLHYSKGRPSEAAIIQMLSVGRPVVIGQNQHLMVIDAVMKDSETGNFSFRFLNTDNNGTSMWKVYSNEEIKKSWFPELTLSPKMSELYIDLNGNKIMERGLDYIYDADGDGIIDFDEEKRFHSLKNSDDSDGDGIKDKIEIMSYTLYEPYGKDGVTKETVADIDGDKKRAEMDDDSDNGGIKDGLEDVNKNGIKEVGETNPYIAFDDYNSSNPMVSGEYALYAISNLRVNDGVKCSAGAGFCNVGAASVNSTEIFPLIVGARASVGNVYSRRNVFFRSHSHIYGNVYLENGSYVDNVSFQNGTIIDGNVVPISTTEGFVCFPVIHPMANYNISGEQNLELLDGRTVDLYDGARYASLKVHNGKIRIHPGEIWVGNLQLEPGAKIEFVAPGYQTVLHVNGNFIWRGTILNNEFVNEIVAKGFKLVQHSSMKMYVDEKFFGTIVAPASHVILGQVNKTFYGSVMADNISVHQYANIYYVKFNPITMMYSFNF